MRIMQIPLAIGCLVTTAAFPLGCSSPPAGPMLGAARPGIWSRTTGAIASGTKKALDSLTPRQTTPEEADPLRLANKAPKPGPEYYLALGRLQESRNNLPAAESQYKAALAESPDHLETLLAYAQFLDRRDRLAEAVNYYERAAQQHPTSARAYNNLGLCNLRRGRVQEALTALTRAVELQPAASRYRNNLATALVETGQIDQALAHLAAVHGPAKAHYNVGYLLNLKGDRAGAAEHFAAALRADPKFDDARTWLAKLNQTPPGNSAHQMAADTHRRDGAANPPVPSIQRLPDSLAPGPSAQRRSARPVAYPAARTSYGMAGASTPPDPGGMSEHRWAGRQQILPLPTATPAGEPPLPAAAGRY